MSKKELINFLKDFLPENIEYFLEETAFKTEGIITIWK